ncbi:MAG TPA: pyridoxal phosphate-dependent aminotransferase [Phenylobacterium sp.]|jgi:aspartate/methionine/tyrosine aminotransferase|uniref:pyridoxal phosphate-dependent aminotransferase n=1 Tax=Phenylobacterium sp. TaxID=1871053 RepID=UPI002D3DCF2C|nr:pyridoxal phosphate-dependent aminotransferase [Phenylobacterium sp.]HZZ70542.1 pyridoxal phosphate-dependent aminotransferase [Phenylobacterium sp.]
MTLPIARPPIAREEVLALRMSQIREVANAGMARKDVMKFWVGESDQPTPAFIREATAKALMEGETYYTHNLGRPDLREALSAYLGGLHGRPFGTERLAITSSGVNALMLVSQAVVSPGDKVVVTTPAWPNIVEIPRILSARLQTVSLDPAQGRWRLDLDKLMDALTPDTRVLFLNSPNNPTGWTLPAEDRAPILARCREYGIWLITDDPYERLIFGPGKSAPSFLPLAGEDERVVSTNTFSKAWRMTGWRMGWMVLPRSLIDSMGVVIEYNTSCAPDFVQSGAIAALNEGEPSIAELRAELTAAKDQVLRGLRALPGIEAPEPEGGMYAFFRIEGRGASLELAKDMVAKADLGLAPGSAFGPEGEGWLRWCFANRPEKNAEGLARLGTYLAGK